MGFQRFPATTSSLGETTTGHFVAYMCGRWDLDKTEDPNKVVSTRMESDRNDLNFQEFFQIFLFPFLEGILLITSTKGLENDGHLNLLLMFT